jgi:hypothetical protein
MVSAIGKWWFGKAMACLGSGRVVYVDEFVRNAEMLTDMRGQCRRTIALGGVVPTRKKCNAGFMGQMRLGL